MNRTKIPQIDSIQELAHFWDTHDLTDFEDELEDVSEPIFELLPQLLVSLDPKELEAFRTLVKSRNISLVDLIRERVLEHIEAS